MHLFDQRILGIAILFLLGGLVVVKRLTTGSIFDKPQGTFLVKLVNIFNLFFLLVVNPLAAILLITSLFGTIDLTRLIIGRSWLLLVIEVLGVAAYGLGFFIMAWALITLNRNYQLGGSAPRAEDKLVTDGPFKMVRNPMYTGALGISLGLACLTQSVAFLAVFFIYLAMIIPLIALEEKGLRNAFGERYDTYRQKVKKLVPFIY
jgi:protein-S-isoprenylcysteine O-methyltransferase Ste14